jgi:hypothetical protein
LSSSALLPIEAAISGTSQTLLAGLINMVKETTSQTTNWKTFIVPRDLRIFSVGL